MSALFVFFCLCALANTKNVAESPQPDGKTDPEVSILSNHMKQLERTVTSLQSQLQLQANTQAGTTAELTALRKSYASLEKKMTELQGSYFILEEELHVALAKQSQNNQLEHILSQSEVKSLRKAALMSKMTRLKAAKGEVSKNYPSVKIDPTALRGNYTSFEKDVVTVNDKLITSEAARKHTTVKIINNTEETVEILKSDLKSVTSQLSLTEETVTQMKSVILGLQRKVNSTEAFYDTLPATNMAFEAVPSYKQHQRMPIVAGSVMKFSRTLYNVGECYSNTTGYFTAPTTGSFMFWVTGVFTGPKVLTIHILRNGVTVGSSYGVSQHHVPGVSSGVIVCGLNDGDKVHFSSVQNATLGGVATSYGGALLHPR